MTSPVFGRAPLSRLLGRKVQSPEALTEILLENLDRVVRRALIIRDARGGRILTREDVLLALRLDGDIFIS